MWWTEEMIDPRSLVCDAGGTVTVTGALYGRTRR